MNKKTFDTNIILDFVNMYIYKNNQFNKIGIENIYKNFKKYFKINTYNKSGFIKILNENYKCDLKHIILREEENEEETNKVLMINSEWLDIINDIKKNNLVISTI